jgi:TolB protein
MVIATCTAVAGSLSGTAADARNLDQGNPTPTPRTAVFTIASPKPSPSGNGDTFTLATVPPTATAEATDEAAPTTDTDTEADSGGVLAYAARIGGQWDIYSLDIDTSVSTQLTSSSADEIAPAWSPDGSQLAYMSGQSGTMQVWVMNRDGSGQRQVSQWSGPGQMFYVAWLPNATDLVVTVADNAAGVAWLVRQPVDGGAPTDYTEPWSGVASVATDTGALAYTVRSDGQTDIVLDDGSARQLTQTGVNEDIPSISRDGTRIVYQVGEPGSRYLEVYDLATGTTSKLRQVGDDSNPVWSPDGQRIAFVSEGGGQAQVYVSGADGSDPTLLPTVEHETLWYLSWTS